MIQKLSCCATRSETGEITHTRDRTHNTLLTLLIFSIQDQVHVLLYQIIILRCWNRYINCEPGTAGIYYLVSSLVLFYTPRPPLHLFPQPGSLSWIWESSAPKSPAAFTIPSYAQGDRPVPYSRVRYHGDICLLSPLPHHQHQICSEESYQVLSVHLGVVHQSRQFPLSCS